MVHIRSLELTHLKTGGLHSLTNFSPSPPTQPPAPGNHHSSLCSYEFSFLDLTYKQYHMQHMSFSVWLMSFWIPTQVPLSFPSPFLAVSRILLSALRHFLSEVFLSSQGLSASGSLPRPSCPQPMRHHCSRHSLTFHAMFLKVKVKVCFIAILSTPAEFIFTNTGYCQTLNFVSVVAVKWCFIVVSLTFL